MARPENTVFMALVHRKFPNALKLPLRYERFFIVWKSTPPFGMVGVSTYPLLMANETAHGWSEEQNWGDEPEGEGGEGTAVSKRDGGNGTLMAGGGKEKKGKPYWAYFTYTVSIAYAWGREPRKGTMGDKSEDMHVGYLDDEVVLGIGVDDAGSVFSRVKARDLMQCMRACPGRVERRRREGRAGV